MAQDFIGLAVTAVVLFAAWKYKDDIVEAVNGAISGLNTIIPPAPGGGGGGGSISQGGSCPGGETCVSDNNGTRMECDAAKPDSYEATWCGSFSGDRMSIKGYGPPHSNDGDCCWCEVIVQPDGGFQVGGEGPHPSSNCEHASGESLGTTSNICVKATFEPGPTFKGYGLVNGQWQEMISYTGPCGCDETSTQKTGDQLSFRVDGNLETTCATVTPLAGSAYVRRRKTLAGYSKRTNKLKRAYNGNLKRAFAATRVH